MAGEMFRDSRHDVSAPGAYTSRTSQDEWAPRLHEERHHQRHVHRNISAPYSHPKKPPAFASGSQNSVVPPDSGAVSDSNGANTSNRDLQHCDGGGQLQGKAQGQTTCAVDLAQGHTAGAVDFAQGQSTGADDGAPMAGEENDVEDDADSTDEDDFEEDGDDLSSNMIKYEDVMNDLIFMDYASEYNEEMAGGGSMTLEEEIIVRIGREPGHTISASKLAEELGKTEEEIKRALQKCVEERQVQVFGESCSLTEKGKALAREMLDSNQYSDQDWSPRKRQQELYSEYAERMSVAQAALQPSHSAKGIPPTPKQLIASSSIFAAKTGGPESSGTQSQDSTQGRGRGRGRGRALMPLTMDSQHQIPPGRRGGHTVSGTHDVRDLEAQSLPPPPPSSLFAVPPPPSSLPSLRVTASFTDQKGKEETTGGFRSVEELNWQPLVPSPQTKTAGDTVPKFPSPQHHQGLTITETVPQTATQGSVNLQGQPRAQLLPTALSSQGLMSLQSQPTKLNQFASMPTSLQKFTEEGLTVVFSINCFRDQPQVDAIEHQMSKTGLSAQNYGGSESNSLQYSGSVSMETGIPRSHSSPLLSTAGPSSLPGGDNSMLKITSESFAALNKNPISALMEYAQSRRMQAVIEVVHQRGPSHRPVFVMAAKVGSRQFPGVTCHNKKDGRKEAADVALRTLIAEGQYSAATPTPSVNIAPENMTHFDKVAALTHQTFNSLIASIPENLAGRKVIAGLVMQRWEDDVGVVISIGTGNRCITGDKLSLEGNTVNDSHAEIITRRGFMRFLYQQLQTYDPNKPHDLFEPGDSGKLRVKMGITFHLYISTAPCGDGALFSPRDVQSNSGVLADVEKREHNPTFTSNVQGLLRTKMEGGEGTIPVDTKEVTMQTWDGVVRGERLRTMSCTDKICRWNVLGLQGALLSHFLEPIYLDSLTLGFLYDHGHLSRAVCCRLARDPPPLETVLPSGFHLNHPWLGRVTACQPLRETQKTKAFSINWTVGDQKPEVLDGTLGHCHTAVEKQLFSRLAKRSLYDSFKQVAQRFGRQDLLQAPSYRHNKMAASDFQAAKNAMIYKFQQMGCGWVKKPVEEEMFS